MINNDMQFKLIFYCNLSKNIESIKVKKSLFISINKD